MNQLTETIREALTDEAEVPLEIPNRYRRMVASAEQYGCVGSGLIDALGLEFN